MKLVGLLFPRFAAKTFAARSPVDIALFGFGVTSAAASVAFAAVMFARAGDAPMVNGMQYLSVFAQPHRHLAVVASVAPESPRAAAKVADAEARGAGARRLPSIDRHVADRLDRPRRRRPERRTPTPTAWSRSSRAWRGCATASRRG